jgi:hypothetical protein
MNKLNKEENIRWLIPIAWIIFMPILIKNSFNYTIMFASGYWFCLLASLLLWDKKKVKK